VTEIGALGWVKTVEVHWKGQVHRLERNVWIAKRSRASVQRRARRQRLQRARAMKPLEST